MPLSAPSLRTALAAGKTRQVIENLLAATAADRDLHTEAVALSARFQNFSREKNAGRADPKWTDAELNRINAAALDLIERFDFDAAQTTKAKGKKAIWTTLAAVAGLLVALFFYLNDRGIFPKKDPPPVVQPAAEGAKPAEKPAELPPNAGKTPKNQTNIIVKDKAKVGNIITGDSNVINIKQDF